MRALSFAAFFLASCARAFPADATQLQFAGRPQLLGCNPVSSVPCFRVKLNLLDANGMPSGAVLPGPDELIKRVAIDVDGQELKPFYASASGGREQVRRRIAMLLIDVSGSMNSKLESGITRFEAARSAARSFVRQFQPGVDSVAVAAFASRHVVDGILSAHFAKDSASINRLLDDLAEPQRQNNTALYSAISTALDAIALESRRSGTDADTILVTLTDGQNDVRPGDDTGLLEGSQGLEQVARKVRESGVETIGVGFGDLRSLDLEALRRASTRTFTAATSDELGRIFTVARTLLNERLDLAFASSWKDRASLAGRTLAIQVRLRTAAGQQLASGVAQWSSPEIGLPIYDDRCTTDEGKALLARVDGADPGWVPVFRPLLVFLGLGTLLFVLWFWAPRLIWPDRYIPEIKAIQERRKWSAASRAGRSRDVTLFQQTPVGFNARGPAPLPDRRPDDATIVRPRMDGETRTRIQFDDWKSQR